jgi:hypothetical protein
MTPSRTILCLVALLSLGVAGERDITLSPVFRKLERALSPFNHDKHTAALQIEGCQACHPTGDKGIQLFTFPKVRDERSAKRLMNSFHDACIGCHRQRVAEKKKAGPLTCGECHRVPKETRRKEYAPVTPPYYDVLRDTYHKDCLACHRETDKHAKEAKPLDWQSLYVKEQQRQKIAWPKTAFDYVVHAKHEKELDKKCDPCHYISPERRAKLAEPKPRDWVLDVDPEKRLTERNAAHLHCLDCHLKRKAEKKKGGPLTCVGCHTEKPRPAQEVAAAARTQCEQKEKMLIELKKDARTKAVPFNHKTHEANSRSCQECHHLTARPCGDCHTLTGSKDGGGITLSEAHHSMKSTWSCLGCHEVVKKKPNCAGCHDRMERGMVKCACNSCHTGTLTSIETVHKLPAPGDLIATDTKEKIEIAGLKKEYKASEMPHLAIAQKLTDISNQSTLASWFHRDPVTVCAGCHHRAPLEKNAKPPGCVTCHTARPPTDAAVPSLLGAYHQQCLGCHKQMIQTEKKLPQNCTGCHAQ